LRPSSLANATSRFNKRNWARIVGGILDVAGLPGFLANAEQAKAELDDTRRQFGELVELMVERPQPTWTATDLARLCGEQHLFEDQLDPHRPRSRATRMGLIAGAFDAEPFELADGRKVTFASDDGRKGTVYLVRIDRNAER